MDYNPKVISSVCLIDGVIPVSKDEVELESGDHDEYTVLQYHNAAAVVALTSDNKIILVRVPRYPIKQYLWELPGGKMDILETPEQCALRELEEETGYKTNQIERLIAYYPEPSFSTEALYIFLATSVTQTGQAIREREGFCEVALFDFRDALNMVFDGRIKSSWSIIGVLLAASRLKIEI